MNIVWDLGRRQLTLPRRPLVMGILNVTPDSFSDGGKHDDVDRAVAAALQMQAAGADIVDIGGESTRPYSDPVAVQDELRRVMPVIERLRGKLSIPISIDTSKSEVAAAAIAGGAEIINDISGLEADPQMINVARDSGVGVCVMHMQGTPQTMQDNPYYENVVEEIFAYLVARRQACLQGGIRHEAICLDPGIGFGKTHQHNLDLLRGTRRLTELGSPILIGHSRKGFIGKVLGDKVLGDKVLGDKVLGDKVLGDKQADRSGGTLGVSLAAAAAGAHVLRVHDVQLTVDALKLFEASGGLDDRK